MSTLVLADVFDRANGAPGNNWTDVDTGVWSIASQVLTSTNTFTLNFNGRWLLRPADEVSGNADEMGVVYCRLSSAGNPQGDMFIVLRGTVGSGNTGYVVALSAGGGSVAIYKFVNGTRTTLQAPLGVSFTSGTVGYILQAGVRTVGGNAVITVKVYRATDVSTPLQSFSKTDSSSPIASGQVGLRNDYLSAITRWQTWSYDGSDPTLIVDAVQVTTPTLGTVTSSSVALSIGTAITGGTSPYSSQLYRSTDPSFTPGVGTAIGSPVTGTTPSFTDSTASANTEYAYKVVVTDSTSPTALTSTTTAILVRTYTSQTALVVGGLGDSTMANKPHNSGQDLGVGVSYTTDINLSKVNAFDAAIHTLRFLAGGGTGLRQVTGVNQASGGATTTDFKPTTSGLAASAYLLSPANNTGTNANVGTGNLRTAIRAYYAAGVTHVLVCFGINDSNPTSTNMSAATFQTNITDICTALRGNGFVPVLCYIGFIPPGADSIWTEAAVKRTLDYRAGIDAVIAAGTAVRGDILNAGALANNPTFKMGSSALTPDLGVHDDQDGGWLTGIGWGWSLGRAMGVIGGGINGSGILGMM